MRLGEGKSSEEAAYRQTIRKLNVSGKSIKIPGGREEREGKNTTIALIGEGWISGEDLE